VQITIRSGDKDSTCTLFDSVGGRADQSGCTASTPRIEYLTRIMKDVCETEV